MEEAEPERPEQGEDVHHEQGREGGGDEERPGAPSPRAGHHRRGDEDHRPQADPERRLEREQRHRPRDRGERDDEGEPPVREVLPQRGRGRGRGRGLRLRGQSRIRRPVGGRAGPNRAGPKPRPVRAPAGGPGPVRLLDVAGLGQELLLERGDRVQRLPGALLPGDGLVELLLLLDEQLEELGDVPHVLLPLQARPERVVPRPEARVVVREVHALQAALAARLGEHRLDLGREPPLHEVDGFPVHLVAVPGGQHEGLSADVGGAVDRPVRHAQPRVHGEVHPVVHLRGLRRDRGLAEPDPLQDPGHLAFPEQLVDLEDVHGPGLDHRGHVLEERQVVLERLDGGRRVHHPFGLRVGGLGLVPDVRSVLPDEGVDLHGREVVALARLVGDPVEIVLEGLPGELVTGRPAEELAEVAHHVPVDVVHLLAGARERLAVPGLERGPLALVAEDVLAEVGDEHVRHLREAVVVGLRMGEPGLRQLRRLDVRIGGVGGDQGGMEVPEHRLELGVGGDEVVELHVVAALDVGPQPLAVGDRHLVLLLAGGQRRGEPGVVVRPRDEVRLQHHVVAARSLVVLVGEVLHGPRGGPVRHRHAKDDVLGRRRLDRQGGAEQGGARKNADEGLEGFHDGLSSPYGSMVDDKRIPLPLLIVWNQ